MFKSKAKKTDTQFTRAKLGPDMDFASTEAYNLLRTNISFSLPDMEGGKIIGVTSSCPQEGKSTTSINLSYALAEAGHKVLLIDSDMRRPSICKALNLNMAPGLSNLLAGNATEEDVRHGVLHPCLSVLLSGDVPPNPAELISSAKMGSVLESFRAEYDYVIVDLPPVNLVSDPLAMSKYVDGVIVVVRHERTRKSDVIETVRQLRFVGARILGFVYNGYKRGREHYYTSHESDYYYASAARAAGVPSEAEGEEVEENK